MSNQTLTTEPKTARRALCQTRFILNTANFLVASEKLSVNAVYLLLQILAEFGKRGFPDSLDFNPSSFQPLLSFSEACSAVKELDLHGFISLNVGLDLALNLQLAEASESLIEKTF